MRKLFVLFVVLGFVLQGGMVGAERSKRKAKSQAPEVEEVGPDDDIQPMSGSENDSLEEIGPDTAMVPISAQPTIVQTEPGSDGVVEDPKVAQSADEDEEGLAEIEVSDGEKYFPLGPILLGSAGVVVAVVGVGVAWQADQEYDSFNEPVTMRVGGETIVTDYPNATFKLSDEITKHIRVANILMIAGGAAVVAGAVWGIIEGLAVRKESSKEKEEAGLSARWRLAAGPNYAGVTVDF